MRSSGAVYITGSITLSFDKEYNIVLSKVPQASKRLVQQVVGFVHELRREDLYKLPGVAETLDRITALVALDQEVLTDEIINDTLGTLLKYRDDIQQIQSSGLRNLLARAQAVL